MYACTGLLPICIHFQGPYVEGCHAFGGLAARVLEVPAGAHAAGAKGVWGRGKRCVGQREKVCGTEEKV